MAEPRHESITTSYGQRATGATHPLTAYLLRLMELKQSNLCVSADVTSARQLLHLADSIGPSIVVLKTHYDLIAGWDYRPDEGTGAHLAALARKHGFLVFEDRKYCDIGSTVQAQYVGGTARVIDWAHIVTANISAGKPMVAAMAEAAAKWRERCNYEVRTSVTVGTPVSDTFDEEDEDMDDYYENNDQTFQTHNGRSSSRGKLEPRDINMMPPPPPRDHDGRKGSIVSITTVTQSFEPADSPRLSKSLSDVDDVVFPGIEESPLERGVVLLAQMSSVGHFLTGEYTKACVEAAREHKEFVMGFVAQENLNSESEDNFLHMTPGCKLPPDGDDESNGIQGDGLGQQYNTPTKLVGLLGTDIIIVGRGIIQADDRQREAERYRKTAWKAYQARLAK